MKRLLIVAALGAMAFGGYSYANYYVSKEARKDVDDYLLQLQAQTGLDVRYKEISSNLFNQSLELNRVVVKGPDGVQFADIDSIELAGFNPMQASDNTRMAINNMTFMGPVVVEMQELDGERINVVSEFNYSADNGDADTKTVINAGKLADVEFSFAMTNSQSLMALRQQFEELEQNGQGNLQQQLALQSQLMTAMTELVPKSFSFKLDNNGKLKDLIQRVIAEQGLTYEQFQQQAQQHLSMSPAPQTLRDAALGFIEGTEQFKVSVSLPEGTTVAQVNEQMMTLMGHPEELAKYFNLKASGK
ncbi:hypothetical protein [Pseudoalteromonas sp. T1lg88]|uniref:hypothetical protein n=1 Tax=Pseudoalteromonas sp. T1lg88 TaxID=2077104 RepID=UPI000CF5F7D4|nr:hypothetical protein [Pseudoalteromonas sp. T1lg88]